MLNCQLKKVAANLMLLALALPFMSGCSPEVGSDAWCADMKEKPKADWTAGELKDFTQHCILK